MAEEPPGAELGWGNPILDNESNEPLIPHDEEEITAKNDGSFYSVDFLSRESSKKDVVKKEKSSIFEKTEEKPKKQEKNEIRMRMRKYLMEKKKKLEQEDRLSRFKFKPNCFSKYYALCCLNCDKLTKNYIQTICQQLLLPLFIIVLPTFFSLVLFLLNSIVPANLSFASFDDVTPIINLRYGLPNKFDCLNGSKTKSTGFVEMRCYKPRSNSRSIIGFTQIPQENLQFEEEAPNFAQLQKEFEQMLPSSLYDFSNKKKKLFNDITVAPQYRVYPSAESLDESIMKNKTEYQANCKKAGYLDQSFCPYDPTLSFVDAGFGFKTLDLEHSKFDYFVQTVKSNTISKAFLSALHRVFSKQMNYQQNPTNTTTSSIGMSLLQSYPISIVSLLSPSYIDALNLLLFPLALSFLLPYYAADIVQEKNRNLIEYVKMYGVSETEYNIFRFIFDYARFIIVLLFLSILGFLSQNQAFIGSRWLILFAGFFLWGLAQVAMGYMLSFFVGTPRKATLVGYFVSFGSMITGAVLNIFVFDTNMPSFLFMLYPPFAFERTFAFLMMEYNREITRVDKINALKCLGFLVGENIILYVVLFLIFFIDFNYYFMTFQNLIEKWIIFPISEHFCFAKISPKESKITNEYEDEKDARKKDLDVQNEEILVNSGKLSEDSVLLLKGLTKSYYSFNFNTCTKILCHFCDLDIFRNDKKKKKKRKNDFFKKAVDSISLSLKDSEIFGLLGPNGAGKSTLIKVLTGEIKPTRGEAVVAGYYLTSQLSNIRQKIGVCPQFDIIWEQLTVKEILLFFARLRGISIFQERAFVETMIKDFGLEEARRRAAGALSGGMRRRLSVAVSMVGDPKIVFLDEPTTGLDPASKRGLWEIILKARKRYCIVLTTHSMEEAEGLCDRIGIVVNGQMACLGTLLHLKQKFGKGYKIQVSIQEMNQESKDKILNFIKTQVCSKPMKKTEKNSSDDDSDIYLDEEFGSSLVFRAPTNRIQLSQVFKIMNQRAHLLGIKDWSISQASLEEVFLKLAKQQYDLLKG